MAKKKLTELGVYFSIFWTLASALVIGLWQGASYVKGREKQTDKIEHVVSVQTKDIDSLKRAMDKNDREHKEISDKVNEIHSDVRVIRVLMEARKVSGVSGYAEKN